MSKSTSLGIWMDHMNAHLIEWTTPAMETKTISSKFTHEAKEHSPGQSEKLMHNKEQHEQKDFYKHLGEAIKGYDQVLLFGPSDAKSELLNLLKADHQFAKIKFEVKTADKMSDKQQHAFVKEYFESLKM
ncbi:MAG TPA: hypothetical protein VGO45_03850 [Bacteroidia bacterium]|jgi:hypothetical protein|nr:hypothetical protein [Bacteroidia bacterium]